MGRFNQPDTIIPQIQGVQAWDRYAYSNNNPVRYNDPTGHSTCSTVSNQYAKENCKNWSPENEDYDSCAFNTWDCTGPIDWSNGNRLISRPIMGLHGGLSWNKGFGLESSGYAQIDILFDVSSGALYSVTTTGNGAYLGTPNGLGGQAYIGTSNVHGIPGDASPGEVEDLLAGENIDITAEIGADAEVEVGGTAGLSLDLDPVNGGFQYTSAGQMYTSERSAGIGIGLIPTGLDLGGETGRSYSNAYFLYQIPWWPAFLP